MYLGGICGYGSMPKQPTIWGTKRAKLHPYPLGNPAKLHLSANLYCVLLTLIPQTSKHIYHHIRVLGLSAQDLDTPNNNGMVEYQAIHLPLCLVSTPVYLVMFSPHSSYQSINFSPCAQAGYGFLGQCTGGMTPDTELTTVPLTA